MSAIASFAINLFALPSLALTDKQNLPSISAVYFVVSQYNEILYIGSSINLLKRWLQHHKQQELEKIGNIRLAWLEINDETLLRETENKLINSFKPVLNNQRRPNQKKVRMSKTNNANRKYGIRWKLREMMARHHIKSKYLANYLGISALCNVNVEKCSCHASSR